MTTPIPQTKAEELLNKFCDSIGTSVQIDAFTLLRFEREALAELKHDAHPAYMLLGAIAAMRWDVAELKRNHLAAIRLSDDRTARANYAVSLERVGLMQEAAMEAEAAFRFAPEDLEILNYAIKLYWTAGQLDSLSALCLGFEKRTMREHDQMDLARGLGLIFERSGTTQEDYVKSIALAHDVLREAKLHASAVMISADTDEGDESILYSLEVPANDEQVAPVRGILAQRLCNGLGDRWRPEVLMFEIKAGA